jgi:hypothetical protein
VRAVLTALDMSAERRGPAGLDRRHHLQLGEAHVPREIRAPMSTLRSYASVSAACGRAISIFGAASLCPRCSDAEAKLAQFKAEETARRSRASTPSTKTLTGAGCASLEWCRRPLSTSTTSSGRLSARGTHEGAAFRLPFIRRQVRHFVRVWLQMFDLCARRYAPQAARDRTPCR